MKQKERIYAWPFLWNNKKIVLQVIKKNCNMQENRKYSIIARLSVFYIFADMEDYIIREIDRIGEMLMQIARRLGLLDGDAPDYSMSDVKDEFGKAGCPVDLVTVLEQEYPVWYLVEKEKLSVHGLETMIDIIFHSDLDEEKKQAMLQDALAYLDGKGYYSFKLHSL